jgi:hypothetical protein
MKVVAAMVHELRKVGTSLLLKGEPTQRNWLITSVNSCFGRIMAQQLRARGDRVSNPA